MVCAQPGLGEGVGPGAINFSPRHERHSMLSTVPKRHGVAVAVGVGVGRGGNALPGTGDKVER